MAELNEGQKIIGDALDLINDMELLLREMDVPIEEGFIITPKRLSETTNDLMGLWEAIG
jgi:hypothetical protein